MQWKHSIGLYACRKNAQSNYKNVPGEIDRKSVISRWDFCCYLTDCLRYFVNYFYPCWLHTTATKCKAAVYNGQERATSSLCVAFSIQSDAQRPPSVALWLVIASLVSVVVIVIVSSSRQSVQQRQRRITVILWCYNTQHLSMITYSAACDFVIRLVSLQQVMLSFQWTRVTSWRINWSLFSNGCQSVNWRFDSSHCH